MQSVVPWVEIAVPSHYHGRMGTQIGTTTLWSGGRHQQEPKPRYTRLWTPTFGAAVSSLGRVAPVETYVEMYYAGETHEKLIARVPADRAITSTLDIDAHLLQFSALYAIDTNTQSFGTDSLSITCLTSGLLTTTTSGTSWAGMNTAAFEMRNVVGESERIGWRVACEHIQTLTTYTTGQSVGLVVDAFRDLHWQINCHAAPVLNGWFLPPGFVLIYAYDGAGGTAANQILKASDRGARIYYKAVASGTENRPLSRAPDGAPYAEYRPWETLHQE